ncbi:MAG: ABC transporter [Alphaproteobacteria bacterium]|nr:ABC transporter [Alphaproteobacteria bacterium]
MWDKLTRTERGRLALGSIVLASVFFVAFNALTGALFTAERLDLTKDRLFTLSAGTKKVLSEVGEPIDIRFYYSKKLDEIGPQIARHAARVRDLLGEFARLSDGRIRIKTFDPQPFSPEEDLAVSDGLQGLPFDQSGTKVYFGVAGTNTTDDVDQIPYLAPERANFLEYDLIRMVNNLANPEKAPVALYSDLPLSGTQQDNFRPWVILSALRQLFDVRLLDKGATKIDAGVDLLIVAQPSVLKDEMLYEIDQFVMRGGRVLAFVDPYAESMAQAGPMMGRLPPPGVTIGQMKPLLESWGVEMPLTKFVGDANAAQRVGAPGPDGRTVAVNYLAWLVLEGDNFNRDDAVSAELRRVVVNSAGAIEKREGGTTTVEPLIWTSKVAQRIDVMQLAQQPDPVRIEKEFQSEGRSFMLAARITGPVKSAYPDGPSQAVLDAQENDEARAALKAAHLAEAKQPVNIILVADADLLADNNWLNVQDMVGQRLTVPIANNADFAINALDNLRGGGALSGLRGRGLSVRPFKVIAKMEKAADQAFRAKEQELRQLLTEAEQKIRRLQGDEGGNTILTVAQQAEIDASRASMLDLRRELRDVQRSLREDVESLEWSVRVYNIWLMPVLVAVFAIGLAVFRRVRAARYYRAEH